MAGEDSQSVLNKLKEKFDFGLIHDSLVDLFEHNYLYEIERFRLIDGILELLHTVEEAPSCKDRYYSWHKNQKYGTPLASDKTLESRPLLRLRIKSAAANLKTYSSI